MYIKLDAKLRDDIPAILWDLQHIYRNGETQAELFALLDAHIRQDIDKSVGRPGMEMWKILVLGIFRCSGGVRLRRPCTSTYRPTHPHTALATGIADRRCCAS